MRWLDPLETMYIRPLEAGSSYIHTSGELLTSPPSCCDADSTHCPAYPRACVHSFDDRICELCLVVRYDGTRRLSALAGGMGQ